MIDFEMAEQIIQRIITTRGFNEEQLKTYIEDSYMCQIYGEKPGPDEKERLLTRLLPLVVGEDSTTAVVAEEEGWYAEWLDETPEQYYWNRLKEETLSKMEERYERAEAAEIVNSIDAASTKVVSSLGNPRASSFSKKGLVLGYVQSGKTANFTAVTAKAVDAGYRIIIVLSGMHDNLRNQTQLRLDEELTGVVPDGHRGRAITRPTADKQWIRLTSMDMDFSRNIPQPFDAEVEHGRPLLIVIKKNVKVMQHLINWLSKADEKVRHRLPLLLIDDEADQASIDINANKEDVQASQTNQAIKDLLGLFANKHAYVGYTATPFANVLIDCDMEDDLYPRDFIVSLNKPKDYIGAAETFRKQDDAIRMFRIVPEADAEVFRGDSKPARKKKRTPGVRKRRQKTFSFRMRASLERALIAHLLACGIRQVRGDGEKAMSMLIHTTHLTSGHNQMLQVVENQIARWRDTLAEEGELSDAFLEKAQTVWREEFEETGPSYAEVVAEVRSLLPEVKVLVLNSKSQDQLDYLSNPGLKVIAIGGNTLSRGLTLEGLMTSYFVRTSKAYDTLLQMGRWFGYRMGYADLTRVYTTEELVEFFQELALVEEEMRHQIEAMEDEGMKPIDVAIQIRAHKTMKVTSAAKFGKGEQVSDSFAARVVPFVHYPLGRPDALESNLQATERMVSGIGTDSFERKSSVLLTKNVPSREVLKFFKDFELGAASDSLRKSMLEYIKNVRQQNPDELAEWNVSFVTVGESGRQGQPTLKVGGLEITPSIRSRERGTEKILSLTAPQDLLADLVDREEARKLTAGRHFEMRKKPHLVIYHLWKDSEPAKKTAHGAPLFMDGERRVDVAAFAVVFPYTETAYSQEYVAQLIGDPNFETEMEEE